MADTQRNSPRFMDISYITPRIIAMSYPCIGLQSIFYNNIASVARYLDKVHADHYLVFNLCSEFVYDPSWFHNRVVRLLLDDHQAPPLTAIQTFCDQADQWLMSDPRNVIVVHCHAGKGRTGTLISCYMLYKHYFNDPEEAMAFFSSKRMKQRYSKIFLNYSQQRYVHYFDQLFKRPVLNRWQSLRLCAIELETKKQSLLASINPLFFTVNCRDTNSVFTSGIYQSTGNSCEQLMEVKESPRVSGDIKITFFHKKLFGKREIFSFWFNTLFVGSPSFSPPGGTRPSVDINGRQAAGPYRTLTLSGDQLDHFSYLDLHSVLFTDRFQVKVYFTEDRGSAFSPSPYYNGLGAPYKPQRSSFQPPCH